MMLSERMSSPLPRPNLSPLLCLAFSAFTLLLSAASHAGVGMTEVDAEGIRFTLLYPTASETRQLQRGPYRIQVAVDAPASTGRHPVMVMSHGTGGNPLADHALAERFVGKGFIVAMPIHRGDNYHDTSQAGPASWRQRPAEVSAVLDYLDSSPEWRSLTELDRVGVHGMSAGGVTGLALAGAQWRPLEIVSHCNDYATEDESFCYAGAHDGSARLGRKLGFLIGGLFPEVALPSSTTRWHGGEDSMRSADARPDPRVAVVTLAVPVVAPFAADSLAEIRIPVGVVGAERDQVLKPDFHSQYLLQHCGSCTRLALLERAGHFDVLWPWPSEVAEQVAARFPVGGVVHEDFDPAERESMQNRIVEFMHQHLIAAQGGSSPTTSPPESP
jgi:predicted dienelactone hydrolase